MKTNILFIIILIISGSLSGQNRKGEFSLRNINEKHELYISFYSDDFLNCKDALETATSLIEGFAELVNEYSISLERGILISEDKLNELALDAKKIGNIPDYIYKLKKIYKVKVPGADNFMLFELAGKFENFKEIEYASLISHEAEKPPYDIMPVTPNYEDYQNYIEDDPGVNMRYAWSLGLTGENIRVRDIEYGVNPDHECLNERNVSIASGMMISSEVPLDYSEHGTAVFGIVYADNANYGATGLAYGASEMVLYPEWQDLGYDRILAVSMALGDSRAGDVIIYEMQQSVVYGDQDYVPAEYNNIIWDLTKAATDAGIIVVAAAGNGNQNLDSETFDSYMARGNSGAIIVGAGTPDAIHEKTTFSTYGSRVDVQGWGYYVFSTGYGNYIIIDDDINQAYTMFSGTSSATPVVASCVIVLQSYYYSRTGTYLTPSEMRDLLVDTGIPQNGLYHNNNIGPLPNMENALKKIDSDLNNLGNLSGVVKDSNGNVIKDVNVKIEETSIETQTNEYGEYQINNILEGFYDVTAAKDGFISKTLNCEINPENTTILDFVLNFDNVNIINYDLDDIKIYPNPARSYINIEGENIKKIEIYDNIGQHIYSIFVEDYNKQNIEINLREFNSGTYVSKIYTDTDVYVKNIVLY